MKCLVSQRCLLAGADYTGASLIPVRVHPTGIFTNSRYTLMLSQFCVFLLCIDAAWVSYGIYMERNRWKWIVLYWVILTLKNCCDIARL